MAIIKKTPSAKSITKKSTQVKSDSGSLVLPKEDRVQTFSSWKREKIKARKKG